MLPSEFAYINYYEKIFCKKCFIMNDSNAEFKYNINLVNLPLLSNVWNVQVVCPQDVCYSM